MNVLIWLSIIGTLCSVGHCAIVRAWGEPHVWAFYDPQQVTCGDAGFKLYLSNPYMDIYTFNWQKSPPNAWTVMTSIEVVLKNPQDGSIIAKYVAPDTVVANPATFSFPAGLTTASAPSTPLFSHVVSVFTSGGYVVIKHSTANTYIVIGNKRGNIILSLNVYMPDALAGASTGFLIYGCPASEVITGPIGRRRRAVTQCSQLGQYSGACEIDSRAIDIGFAVAAGESVRGGDELAAKLARRVERPEPVQPGPQQPERPERPPPRQPVGGESGV